MSGSCKKHKNQRVLQTLSALALTLPGIQMASAEPVISKPQTDFRYTRYDEGDSRYKIDIYQAYLGVPLGEKMDLTVKAGQDVMSGASSAFYHSANLRDRTASPSTLVESRTGNSIHDQRSTGDLNVRFFGDGYHVGIGAGISEENDYESNTCRIQVNNEFNKTNTESTFGYSLSNDSIKPIPQANNTLGPRKQTRDTKITHDFYASLKQDLGKITLIEGGVQFIANQGFLSDPYKRIYIYGDPNREGAIVLPVGLSPFAVPVTVDNDARPKYRGTLALNTQLIQHIPSLKGSFHLGYRFVKNTWDIRSHTVNLSYHQELDSWEIIPSLRYYTQSQAYFYSMAFDAIGGAPFAASRRIGSTGPASSDYRLAKFGSITGELKLHYKFMADQSGKLTLAFGLINRRNNFAWGKKPNPLNPTNDFKSYYSSVGISFVF